MLSNTTTSKAGIDLAVAMIPYQELICSPSIIALIKHMYERRTGSVTHTNVEAPTGESVELVLIERHVNNVIDAIYRNVCVSDEPLGGLPFSASHVDRYTFSVAPSDSGDAPLIVIRLERKSLESLY